MRPTTLAALLLLAGCSREAPSAAPPPHPRPAPLPAPTPVPPESGPPEPPAPAPAPAPTPVPPKSDPPEPSAPSPAPPDIRSELPLQSPTFTFRSLDGPAEVRVNGERIGVTPYPWWVSGTTSFDPRIPVETWPPPDAVFASRGVRRTDDGVWTSMELWISGGRFPPEGRAALLRAHPHLADGEHVLYVRSFLGPCERRGAVRVRVDGRGFVSYVPTHVTEESEDYLKWTRSLWFERGE